MVSATGSGWTIPQADPSAQIGIKLFVLSVIPLGRYGTLFMFAAMKLLPAEKQLVLKFTTPACEA
jgi:hypothetical protein